jgi:uncharacterized protein
MIGLGALIPLVAFPILRYVRRLNRYDAGALAAQYDSVSVVTYAVAITFLAGRGAE